MEDWSRYGWLDEDDSDFVMAGCLGVATDATRDVVLRAFAAEHELGDLTLADAWAKSESDFGCDIVQVARVDSVIVTVEPNGWHGVDGRVAAEISRDGTYAAFYWNVNAQMMFLFARGGLVVRQFDPLLYDEGSELNPALPEERDLPFPRDDSAALMPRRAALALLELLTGVRVTRHWLVDEPRPTFRRALP